jgi:hypothetical protein
MGITKIICGFSAKISFHDSIFLLDSRNAEIKQSEPFVQPIDKGAEA